MRMNIKLIICFLLSITISMCVSVEEKKQSPAIDQNNETQNNTDTKNKDEVTADKAGLPALTDQDFLDVLLLVTRAKDAGAESYSPLLYKNSKDSLADALSARLKSPGEARKFLDEARANAVSAYEETGKSVYRLFIEPIDGLVEKLDNIDAKRYYPEEYAACIEEGNAAAKYYAASDIAASLASGKKAVEDMTALDSRVTDTLAWVRILLKDIEQYLDKFELDGTYLTNAENTDLVVRNYYAGLDALASYNLEKAGASLGAARRLCEGSAIAEAMDEKSADRIILPLEAEATATSKQKTYSIRSVPSDRESLWTIAGYDFVYADPFLWPLIWRMNRDKIENPAFILPGTLIVIPEIK
jgi:nucleoid-associated protein YgaU